MGTKSYPNIIYSKAERVQKDLDIIAGEVMKQGVYAIRRTDFGYEITDVFRDNQAVLKHLPTRELAELAVDFCNKTSRRKIRSRAQELEKLSIQEQGAHFDVINFQRILAKQSHPHMYDLLEQKQLKLSRLRQQIRKLFPR